MKRIFQLFVLGVSVLAAGQSYAAADVYTIDDVHSSLGFSVKHLMVSTTHGAFKEYAGTIAYDPVDPTAFKANVTIQAKSIDTDVQKRDDHLRGPDFFEVEKYPTITFTSKTLTGKDGVYTLLGDLTMHGVTKEISLPLTVTGPIKNPMGGDFIIGLEGQSTINRQDFGINWNKAFDNWGLAVGNDVTIRVALEAHRKSEAETAVPSAAPAATPEVTEAPTAEPLAVEPSASESVSASETVASEPPASEPAVSEPAAVQPPTAVEPEADAIEPEESVPAGDEPAEATQ